MTPTQPGWRVFALGPALLALHLLAAAGSAAAETVEAFYRGKTISLLVGYPPGGANDVYGRLAARHLGEHIPGRPSVVTMNMPGAGSLRAANHIFRVAPGDGTVLGLLVPTLALEAKLGSSAAKFKASQFGWIGRLATATGITFVTRSARVQSIADAFTTEVVLGATGRSATNAIYPTVLNNVLATKFRIVTGYEGSAAAMMAMDRGEVDGHSATLEILKAVRPDWLTLGKIKIIVQYSAHRSADLPDIPTAVELARTPEQAAILRAISSGGDIGKFLLTTPRTPADRIEALRRAFDAMVQSPAFGDDAKQLRLELDPLPGERLQRIVEEVEALSPDITEKVKAIYPLN